MVFAGALEARAQNWQIVPGRSAGPINRNTSEKELIKIFGARNVRRSRIDIGEGETQPGTILFPNDPRKRAFILWLDPKTRQQPESISIRGRNTVWKTTRGITLGTTLRTIETLNGRPFIMTGFAWDYSGTVLHSNGGRLIELGVGSGEEIKDRTLLLRLEPATALQRTPEYNAVLGDADYSSDNPAMRRLNPRVYEIVVQFASDVER
jgi:hypothetical protein